MPTAEADRGSEPGEAAQRSALPTRPHEDTTALTQYVDDTVLTAKDYLPEARSVIITGTPAYMGETVSFEECRKDLLGRAEPSHVTVQFLLDGAERGSQITGFFTGRGFQCFALVGSQFPIKLIASQCGVGFYGKNAIIQHPDFGSWISLSAYVTDAELEPVHRFPAPAAAANSVWGPARPGRSSPPIGAT